MKKSGIHTINAGALEKSPITPGCLYWGGDIPGRGLSTNAKRDMLACSLARCLLLLLATRLFPLTAKSPQSANQGFHGRQERIPFKCRASTDSLKLYGLALFIFQNVGISRCAKIGGSQATSNKQATSKQSKHIAVTRAPHRSPPGNCGC